MANVADITDAFRAFQDWFIEASRAYEPIKYIRIIAIVGAYLLIRPYLVSGSKKKQTEQHEQEIPTGKITSNNLRGQVEVPEDTSDEDADEKAKAEASGAQWGKKARRRQRQMIKNILEADEKKKLLEDGWPSDDDLEQYFPQGSGQNAQDLKDE